MKILVIEDSEAAVRSMDTAFRVAWPDCQLIPAATGERGVELVETESPDIVILELSLPHTDGLQVLKEIRLFSDVSVIIVTVRGEETDKAAGLQGGADDYIVKPFAPLDLISRTRAVLRRSGWSNEMGEDMPTLVAGNLTVNFKALEVFVSGQRAHLTPTEWNIFYQLVRHPGGVVTHWALKERVWHTEHVETKTVNKHINRLRHKLHDTHSPGMIISVPGVGYKFVKPG